MLGTQGRLARERHRARPAHRGRRSRERTDASRATWCSCRGGYTPSVHLFSQSRGKLAWSEALQAFIPGAATERTRSAGACRGVAGLEAALNDGAACGAAAAREALDPARTDVDPAAGARRAVPPALVPAPCEGGFVGALPQPGADPRPRLRRLAERRDGEGSCAGAARRLPLHRARQALHDHRHGDRSGQDLQPERARRSSSCALGKSHSGGGAHHLPHALHAGHLRQLRGTVARANCSTRSARRRCTPGRPRRARCSRTWACGSARATSRAPAKTCTPRWRASASPSAPRCGIFDASTLGKIEVVGPGCGELHEPPVRQHLDEPCRRALPLRHPAAR